MFACRSALFGRQTKLSDRVRASDIIARNITRISCPAEATVTSSMTSALWRHRISARCDSDWLRTSPTSPGTLPPPPVTSVSQQVTYISSTNPFLRVFNYDEIGYPQRTGGSRGPDIVSTIKMRTDWEVSPPLFTNVITYLLTYLLTWVFHSSTSYITPEAVT